MRKMMILAAGAALAFATSAGAQPTPVAPAEPSAPAAPVAPSAPPAITTINIVDFAQLPEATKAEVNELISKSSDADLQKLRGSIDATPEIKLALEARALPRPRSLRRAWATTVR